MKILGVILLGLFSFALALVGALAFTGNLNQEGIDKLRGKNAPEPVAQTPLAPDELSETAKALKEREEELNQREASIAQEQKRLDETQNQMEELRSALQQLIAELSKSADEIDAGETARLQAVADSLAGMKPAQAAMALEEWAPDQGARLLQLIEERSRGKILDGMDQKKAADFLRAMAEQQAALPPESAKSSQ